MIADTIAIAGATAAEVKVARLTGLEPATPGVTGRYSNQLSYNRAWRLRYDKPTGSSMGETEQKRRFSAVRNVILQPMSKALIDPVEVVRTGTVRQRQIALSR